MLDAVAEDSPDTIFINTTTLATRAVQTAEMGVESVGIMHIVLISIFQDLYVTIIRQLNRYHAEFGATYTVENLA